MAQTKAGPTTRKPKPNLPKSVERVSILAAAFRTLRLTWRLCCDPRVSGRAKLVPILGVIGWILPIIDVIDIIFFVAICEFFISLCPPLIVAEHLRAINGDTQNGEVVRDE